MRAATALISDGVLPSNKDRGYVLRRLIRRAIIKGEEIGIKKNFVSTFSYENSVSKELEREESKFRETLAVGLKEFEKWFSWQSKPNRKIIPGSVVFDLYQTYGFPIELTEEIAQDRGLTIEKKEFERKL